jgi:hypothetical protein
VIKYYTKKELMQLWIERKFTMSMPSSIIESIEEKVHEMPKDEQPDIKEELKKLKSNPSVIFEEKPEDIESYAPEAIDYESAGFKAFEKAISNMKKMWLDNEERFIKEIQAEYKKQGITIIVKEE